MKHLPLETIQFLFKQIYSMLKAHIPINKALKLIVSTTSNRTINETLIKVVNELESGLSLSQSFNNHPHIFSKQVVAMIEVGEQSGEMKEIVKNIVKFYEFEISVKKRLKQVSRYPIFVLGVIIIAIIIVNIFIIPKFLVFFSQFGAQLPLPTRMLIASSVAFTQYWFLILAIFIISITFVMYCFKEDKYKYFIDKWLLLVPIVGSIIERTLLAKMTRTLSLALKSGLPINQALAIIEQGIGNLFLSDKLLNLRLYIEHGETFSQASRNCGLFSSLNLQMIVIGEEIAELDMMLFDISKWFEDELEFDVKRLSDIMEPVLISIVALFVLFLALGVFLPMWDLSSVTLNQMKSP